QPLAEAGGAGAGGVGELDHLPLGGQELARVAVVPAEVVEALAGEAGRELGGIVGGDADRERLALAGLAELVAVLRDQGEAAAAAGLAGALAVAGGGHR